MITKRKKNKKLSREDFYSHIRIHKLSGVINKKTLAGFNYMYIRDKQTIKFLQENVDWLDYVGITISYRKDKKQLYIKWDTTL